MSTYLYISILYWVSTGPCNPSYWDTGIRGWLVDKESAKGLKWPAEDLHYTWGSIRSSVHTQIPLGADRIPIW